jgi:uncharacterized membrane protein
VGIILLVRWLGGGTSAPPDREAQDEKKAREEEEEEERDPALETLRRRYAAGEISQEEYENMRKTLER